MGSDANRLRRIWQTYSGRNAANAENDFFIRFRFPDSLTSGISNFKLLSLPCFVVQNYLTGLIQQYNFQMNKPAPKIYRTKNLSSYNQALINRVNSHRFFRHFLARKSLGYQIFNIMGVIRNAFYKSLVFHIVKKFKPT